MLSRKDAIGIFDSGVGGLTVFKEVRRKLPAEKLIYLGDTARLPYGTKSKEVVQLYSLQNARFLQQQGIKALVVACNSASACALPLLKRTFPKLPITGVILPGAKAAVKTSKNNKVAVIGTPMTVRSLAYYKSLKRLKQQITIYQHACPLFVPLVEEGLTKGKMSEAIIDYYLAKIKQKKIDTLILGCTHYPLLKSALKQYLGKNVKLVDSAVETAKEITWQLEQLSLLQRGHVKGHSLYYVSDTPAKFRLLAKRFIGQLSGPVKKIQLD